MKLEEKLPDDIQDPLGRLLVQFREISTWTQQKRELFSVIEELAVKNKYKTFTADCRDYHLQRKGDSCLYVVPKGQHGALAGCAGTRVRLICGGAWDSYSGRRYWVSSPVDGSEPPQRHSESEIQYTAAVTTDQVLKEFPLLYVGRRMLVIDNSGRVLNEDYDVVVWDRQLRCEVGFCHSNDGEGISGWVAYGPNGPSIAAASPKQLAQDATRVMNWSLRN